MSSEVSTELLPHVIDNLAQTDPDSIWLEFPKSSTGYDSGFERITYAKFANAVNGMARLLEKALGRKDTIEPIAYLAPNDARCAITVVAAIKAGYASFLTSDRNSVAAQLSLFDDLNCTTIVTTNPPVPAAAAIVTERSMNIVDLPTLEELLSKTYPKYPYDKDFASSRDDIAFVCHTSGSTGFPRTRLYTHDFIARTVRNSRLEAPEGFETLSSMTGNNRCVLLLPVSHPAGFQFGILNAIFNRCTVILPLPSVPPTGETLAKMLKHTQADWAATAPLTLETISKNLDLLDSIVLPLKMLLYAGGSLPKVFGNILASKIKLVTGLGSSETGAFPTLYCSGFDYENDWNYLQVHPAMGVKFEEQRDHVFEMVLERSPESEPFQPVFTHFPDLIEYRTKDLFTPHPQWPDLWSHASRSDDIIVFLNSEKLNPITFESQVSIHAEVATALMFGNQRFEAGLLIELVDQKEISASERAAVIERLWPAIEDANKSAPAYANISKSHICFTDPGSPVLRTLKGTVRRKTTLDLYAQKIDRLYTDIEEAWTPLGTDATAQKWSNPESLKALVREFIPDVATLSSVDDDTDLFSRGIDSLGVLRLVRYLKSQTRIPNIEPSIVYLNPSITALAQALQEAQQELKTSDEARKSHRKDEIDKTLQAFCKHIDELAASHSKCTESLDGQTNSLQDHCVVLTGSTGSIGSYILRALLDNPNVSHIYCLNRAADSAILQKERNASVDSTLPTTFSEGRVSFLTVDLSKTPSLGLDSSVYTKIQDTVSLIIHNAWTVDFNFPLTSFSGHLAGIVNLIALSAQSILRPPVLFLSSISSVANLHTLSTSAIPESIVTELSAPASGYGESKYIAERILSYATEKHLLRTGIVRIGQVSGAARSSGRWNSSEWIPSLIISSQHLRVIPDTLGPANIKGRQDIDWIPVDVLSDVLLELGFELLKPDSSQVKVYQPHNPNRTSWGELLPWIVEAINYCLSSKALEEGGALQIVTPQEWLQRLRASAAPLNSAVDSDALIKANPALKLVDFYELLFNDTVLHGDWETGEAVKASPSLRNAKVVNQSMIEGWVKAWCTPV